MLKSRSTPIVFRGGCTVCPGNRLLQTADDFLRVVGRSSVDDDDLDLFGRLADDAFEGAADERSRLNVAMQMERRGVIRASAYDARRIRDGSPPALQQALV